MPSELPAEWPVYSDPITGFYDTLVYDHARYGPTSFYAFLAEHEADAWEREAGHIFAYLKENAHPHVLTCIDLEQMEEDFFTYVKTQAFLDAYIGYTSLLDGSRMEHVMYGTGFNYGVMRARTAHYQAFVKEWYEALSWDHGFSPLDLYVFSSTAELDRLMEGNGLEFAKGDYRLEAAGLDREEGLENPIDDWTSRYLYWDGTTAVAAADAALKSDLWAAELCHAYDVLEEQATPAAELTEELETAREALLRFAPVHGDCIALTYYSVAFSGGTEESIGVGTQANVDCWSVCGDYYRRETLSLWAKMLERLEEEQLTWVFASDAAKDDMVANHFALREECDMRLYGGNFASSQAFLDHSGYLLLKEPPESVDTYSRDYCGDVCVEVFRDNWNEEDVVLLTNENGLCQEVRLTSERYSAGIGGVTAADVDFDGNDDLLLFIGGERGGQYYYAAFLWEPETESYTYEPAFSEISAPRFDYEHKVIWGGCDLSYGYFYYAYELIGGTYTETHRLVGEYGNIMKCTEYVMADGKMEAVAEKLFPDKTMPIDAVEQCIASGTIWEGWAWCDPRAYERYG